MSRKKRNFTDNTSASEDVLSYAESVISEGLTYRQKKILQKFARQAEKLPSSDNSFFQLLKETGILKLNAVEFEEPDLSDFEKNSMTLYKEFFEVERIYSISSLCDAAKRGKLLAENNNSSFSFLELFIKAMEFEKENGYCLKKHNGNYFAYSFRILVENDLPLDCYSPLADFVMCHFNMKDNACVVFAEKRGSGTYIRIIAIARQYYPEGFEKPVYSRCDIAQDIQTGRLLSLKTGAEVPAGCRLLHRKGDVTRVEMNEFGNKNASFSKSKDFFTKIVNEFKEAFRNEMKEIGHAKEPGFYFPKINESKILNTALATKHAACATNDVLNYAEKKIKETLEKLRKAGVEDADEKIYRVYIYFYNKVKRLIQYGRPVHSSFECNVYVPDINGIKISRIQTFTVSYFFSLVAKYARKEVYLNLANFLLDLELSLQSLLEKEEIESRKQSFFTLDEFDTKQEGWRDVVRHIRPRIVKLRQRLDEREYRRLNPKRRHYENEEISAQWDMTWEEFEEIETGEEFIEEDSPEIPVKFLETVGAEAAVPVLHNSDDLTALFQDSLFELDVLKQE